MTGLAWLCEAGCGRALQLLVRTNLGLLCPPCVERTGAEPISQEAHQRELATHDRMLARKGADAYMVKAGRT